MFTFAVCDDQREDAENLRRCIFLFAQTQEIPVQTDVFSDGAALLNASQHYDLIFLDVEMSPMSGIETAKELRKREAFLKVPIVYVTSYPDYWRHAYQVHAFDFIEKPFPETRVFQTLRDFLRLVPPQDARTIPLQVEAGEIQQRVDEICYFLCTEKRRVIVHTTSAQYVVKDSLNSIYAQLDPAQFDMPHRCCIVNFRYVQNIVNYYDIIMTDGEFLPLAQKKRTQFRRKLSDYMQSQNNSIPHALL